MRIGSRVDEGRHETFPCWCGWLVISNQPRSKITCNNDGLGLKASNVYASMRCTEIFISRVTILIPHIRGLIPLALVTF